MSGLVILASYPKSGNTWMRAVLASLARGGRTPDINSELTAYSLSWRDECDSWIGVQTSDLTSAEIAMVRPYISRRAAEIGKWLVKVHDANLAPPDGYEPPYPPDSVDRVIYVVRDPRDVAVSSIHHYGKPIETIVSNMNDPVFCIGVSDSGLASHVRQLLSTWSRHVESWLDAPGIRVHHVRYEDMANEPEQAFAAAANFLGLEHTSGEIARAIKAASFESLAGQETRVGFRERLPHADTPFFRRGKTGAWHTELPQGLADQIIRDHGLVMRRLGYVD